MRRMLERARRRTRDWLSILRPNVPPIFGDCCLSFSQRLHRPWIADGRIWASDGRICVWAWLDHLRLSDRERAMYAVGSRKVPDLATITREFWHHPGLVRLPWATRHVACRDCQGSGHSSHDPDYPCYDCEGTGLEDNAAWLKVSDSDVHLKGYYVGLLRDHGIDRVLIPLREEWPVRFDAGAVSGLLMPRVKAQASEIEAGRGVSRPE